MSWVFKGFKRRKKEASLSLKREKGEGRGKSQQSVLSLMVGPLASRPRQEETRD